MIPKWLLERIGDTASPTGALRSTEVKRTGESLHAAFVNTFASLGRLFGNSLAVLVATAVFVAILTLGSTMARQVAADFDVLRATEVRITPSGAGFPDDYRERLDQVVGIDAIERLGTYATVRVSSSPPSRPDLATEVSAEAYGVEPGGPDALRVGVQGVVLDHSVAAVEPRQVLIGSRLAAELGIGLLDGSQAVWIEGRPYVVRGVITDSPRRTALRGAVVLLNGEATRLLGPPSTEELVLETTPGAASMVAALAPLALAPQAPESYFAIAPPDPGDFRRQIEGRVRAGLLTVAAVATVAAVLMIANSMAIAVVTRRFEIGLRRALGATRADVFVQFLSEATLVGLAGGLMGVSVGVVGAVAVAMYAGWAPVLDPAVVLIGVAGGVATGVLAGLVPARRAARVNPIEALRSRN
jgi:putative ABC transport system permease protein